MAFLCVLTILLLWRFGRIVASNKCIMTYFEAVLGVFLIILWLEYRFSACAFCVCNAFIFLFHIFRVGAFTAFFVCESEGYTSIHRLRFEYLNLDCTAVGKIPFFLGFCAL